MKLNFFHKKGRVILLLVSLLILLMLWFRPLSFPQDFSQKDFHVSIIGQYDILVDNFTLMPYGNIESFKISSSSVAHETLLNILMDVHYFRCYHTVTSDWFSSTGESIIRISTIDYVVYLSKDTAHIVVNGEIYRVYTPSNLYQKCLEVIEQIP